MPRRGPNTPDPGARAGTADPGGSMNDSSRTQGGLICVGPVIVAGWVLLGLLQKSYWAIALPVAAVVFFALGLTFWVGYTIATIQVEPFEEPEPPAPDAQAGHAPNDASA